MSKESGLTKDGRYATAIGVIGLILALAGLVVTFYPRGEDNSGEPVTGSLGTPVPETTTPSTPPTDDEAGPGGIPEPVPEPVQVRYLSELEPKGNSDMGTAKTVKMRNQNYDSIIFSLNTFNGGWKHSTYVVPDGFKFFDATIGLDDETDDDVKAQFRLKINGNEFGERHSLGSGTLRRIQAPLPSGTYTVELAAQGLEAEGVGRVGSAVWGNARFCRAKTCR